MNYSTLRDLVLKKNGYLGQAEAEDVVEVALHEAMRYTAFNVRIPSLIKSAQATAPASASLEANAISIAGGAGTFQVSDFQTVDRLFIKKDSTVIGYGMRYDYLEYHYILDIMGLSGGKYTSITDGTLYEDLPNYWYTITPSGKIWAGPIKQNNVLTLFYRSQPAAYGDSTTPEISEMFDYILLKAGELALKEFDREPDGIITMWDLFEQHLRVDLDRYDQFLNGQVKKDKIKIHKSYRVY